MGLYRIWHQGDWETIAPVGRYEWALRELMAAGSKGVTPIEQPAPRWSHYIFKLRRIGVCIETIHEPHGGPFKGFHARYVLHSKIEPWEDRDAA